MLKRFAAALALAAMAAGAAAQPSDAKKIPDTGGEGLSEPTLYEFLLGEIAVQRGDYQTAAETYLDLAKRTRDPRIARRAVEVANEGKLTELALQAAKLWQDIEPASPAALQVTAALLISAKRVDEAEPYLEKLLTSPGVNLEAGFLQLNRLLAGNPDKAANLRVARKLAARHDKLPQAHFAVAQAAALAGDDGEALKAIRRAEELRPDWDSAVLFEAQLLQKNSTAEAAKRLGEFVAAHPDSRDARLGYARALVMDKRLPEARKQFEAVLAANPGNTELVYAVGVLAFQLKDYPLAEENMKKLLGMSYRDPDAVRYILGQIAEEQKDWPRAVQWYDQIKDGEHAMPARLRTANAMAKQGKLDAARDYLHKVVVDNPDDQVQVTVAEAQLLRDAKRYQEAFDFLGGELKKDPEEPELLYDYALTAEKVDRFDVLENSLKKLIQVKPDHAHAYNALGYSLADRNERLPEARKLIEKALELAPDDYFIVDSMGWVQYREGNLKGAAQTLRRAYDGRPDPEIGAHLGEVLWKMGNRAEANRVWEESLKNAPDNETLRQTIQRVRK
ncbi:MAG TPA: tetratricopeptide repeat protein [Burkholderiales bacterium]|jgi:tetratricopeptide (TPR) repeat protein|nr:tetratricopeptide repeat protein [Burkholderiales bacterium]